MRSSKTSKLAISFLMYLIAGTIVWADESPVENAKNETILERFAISKNGDALLIPVIIENKEYQFMVDTGCTCSCFDSSFHLGVPQRKILARTPTGNIEVPLCRTPNAKIGKLDLLTTGLVFSKDLSFLRKLSGLPIMGLLGMDFLRHHRIRLDFDRGELLFLSSVSRNCGDRFRLSYEDWVPVLDARIGNSNEVGFELDTGSVAFASVNLKSRIFNNMLEHKLVTIIGSTGSTTVSGSTTTRLASGKASLKIGSFTLDRPIICESDYNFLGLPFLSRFIVTFDFPNDFCYLKTNKQYSRSDLMNRSGLGIIRDANKTVITSVDIGSSAERCLLRAGDLILKIDGNRSDCLTMFEIRRILAKRGVALRLNILRDNQLREVLLELDN